MLLFFFYFGIEFFSFFLYNNQQVVNIFALHNKKVNNNFKIIKKIKQVKKFAKDKLNNLFIYIIFYFQYLFFN